MPSSLPGTGPPHVCEGPLTQRKQSLEDEPSTTSVLLCLLRRVEGMREGGGKDRVAQKREDRSHDIIIVQEMGNECLKQLGHRHMQRKGKHASILEVSCEDLVTD